MLRKIWIGLYTFSKTKQPHILLLLLFNFLGLSRFGFNITLWREGPIFAYVAVADWVETSSQYRGDRIWGSLRRRPSHDDVKALCSTTCWNGWVLQKAREYDTLKKAEVYLVQDGARYVNCDGWWAFYRMNNALATQRKWWIWSEALMIFAIHKYIAILIKFGNFMVISLVSPNF